MEIDPGHSSDPVLRRTTETWLRRRGLPMTVLHNRSALERSSPALASLLFLDAALVVDDSLFGEEEGGLLVVAGLILAPLIGWSVALLNRRLGKRARRVVAWSLAALVPCLTLLNGDGWQDIGVDLAIVIAIVVTVYFGIVSIVGWAMRIALRRFAGIGELASRALPLLMIFTIFGFFTAEVWQAIEKLTPGTSSRLRLWLVVAFFAVLTGLLLLAALRDEADDLIERLRIADPSGHAAALSGTPLAELVAGQIPRRPLRRPEQLNLKLLLFVGHGLQTLVLALVVFAFFVAFGAIAIDHAVIESWVGHPATVPGALFTARLPLPVADELIEVALFLSAFSGMYFAAHMAREDAYRRKFFEPLFAEVALTLSGRDVYLAVWDTESDAPPPAAVQPPPAAEVGDRLPADRGEANAPRSAPPSDRTPSAGSA